MVNSTLVMFSVYNLFLNFYISCLFSVIWNVFSPPFQLKKFLKVNKLLNSLIAKNNICFYIYLLSLKQKQNFPFLLYKETQFLPVLASLLPIPYVLPLLFPFTSYICSVRCANSSELQPVIHKHSAILI